MFDDVDCADAIAYIFTGTTLPSIDTELRESGATVADGECTECGGVVYNHQHEVVCGNCSLVIGAESTRTEITQWQLFRDNRPEYYHSDSKRCPGGFPQAYDWVKREDIDRPVKKLNASLFYE